MTKPRCSVACLTPVRGISLIEVMVALLILSVGLLGLAGIQVTGLRGNQSAYLKTQAGIIAADVADRLRLNSEQAIAGVYDGFNSKTYSGSGSSCLSSVNGCTNANLAIADMVEWKNLMEGTGGIALLPNASLQIIRGAGSLFTITVLWSETDWDADTGSKQITEQSYSMNFSL